MARPTIATATMDRIGAGGRSAIAAASAFAVGAVAMEVQAAVTDWFVTGRTDASPGTALLVLASGAGLVGAFLGIRLGARLAAFVGGAVGVIAVWWIEGAPDRVGPAAEMQRAFAPLGALLTGLLFAGGFLIGSALVRVVSREGRHNLVTMTGPGRYAFWGIVAFLVIVIIWFMLQMM